MDSTFLSTTILLVLITDPLGNIPFFISALKNVRPERRRRVVLRECLIAFAALLVFLLAGCTSATRRSGWAGAWCSCSSPSA